MKMHDCNLDYKTMIFEIRLPFTNLQIPMNYGLTHDSTIIPARSEVYRMFRVKSTEFPCMIEPRELTSEIYIPNTIAYYSYCWIRVLNTSSEHKQIPTADVVGQSMIFLIQHPLKTNASTNFTIF